MKSTIKLLVIGLEAQIGRELSRTPAPAGVSAQGLKRRDLDITDAAACEKVIAASGCDVVINCAAYNAVDRAVDEPGVAFAVNRDGAGNVAAACSKAEVALVHLSSDYVFDGNKRAPYVEEDRPAPLSVYGASKEAGERAVRERVNRHIILRTSWVFSPFGTNFVKTMLRLAREREEIAVVDDQVGCPTCAANVASAIMRLASDLYAREEGCWGTYHYCDLQPTTWHDFADVVFDELARRDGHRPALRRISSKEYPGAAVRPAYSVLACNRIATTFGVLPAPWRNSIPKVVDEILAASLRAC